MPAASERRVFRPLGVRLAGLMLVVAFAGTALVIWAALPPAVLEGFNTVDYAFLWFFGVIVIVVIAAMTRSRVVADPDGLRVVNGFRTRRFEWAQVVAVSMPPGAPWARVDISDGTTVPAMGIQGSDGDRARQQIRDLRGLIASHQLRDQPS